MVDKKLEKQIARLKEFDQAWSKFFEIYQSLVKSGNLSKEDETVFLGERDVIKRKYKERCELLDISNMTEYADPISGILNVQNLFSASDSQNIKLEDDWEGSFLFLKNLLKAFESKYARVRESLGLISFLQKVFNNIWVVIITSLAFVFFMYYALIKFVIVKL